METVYDGAFGMYFHQSLIAMALKVVFYGKVFLLFPRNDMENVIYVN